MFIHAAGLSGPAPVDDCYALALESTDLDLVCRKLDYFDIPHVKFHEPDEPWNGELLSIGIYPCEYEKLKPVVRNMKLAFNSKENK